jgi:hypothetical protein
VPGGALPPPVSRNGGDIWMNENALSGARGLLKAQLEERFIRIGSGCPFMLARFGVSLGKLDIDIGNVYNFMRLKKHISACGWLILHISSYLGTLRSYGSVIGKEMSRNGVFRHLRVPTHWTIVGRGMGKPTFRQTDV